MMEMPNIRTHQITKIRKPPRRQFLNHSVVKSINFSTRKSFNPLRGFTLVEMLVVIGMMGLALSAYAASIAAIPVLRSARFKALAIDIAVKRMEEIKALPWDSATGSGVISDSALTALPKGAGVWGVTVPETNLKEAMVRVQWEEPGQSAAKQYELRTYLVKGGT